MIHTTQSLRNQARRLDRRNLREELNRKAAAQTLAAMKAGAVLHRTNRFKIVIRTCNGAELPPEAAAIVTKDECVVGVDDGLFPGLSQTWRWAGDP